MYNANDVLQAVKCASLLAVEQQKPLQLQFGTVETVSPLSVRIDQKMFLGAAQLIVTRAVTNYTAFVTVDDETELPDSGIPHKHPYKGLKTVTVHNGLTIGETVVLMRMQGGQQYLILDRVVMNT